MSTIITLWAPTLRVTSPFAVGESYTAHSHRFLANIVSAYTKDDAPGTTKNPAGPFGDHKCDTPVNLEQSMYKAIKEAVPDVAFALFTGDIVDHTIWNTTKESNVHDSKSQITDWLAHN